MTSNNSINKIKSRLFIALLLICILCTSLFVFTACKKEDEAKEDTTTYTYTEDQIEESISNASFSNGTKNLGVKDFPNMLDDPRYTYGTTLFFGIWSGLASTILIFTSSLNSIDRSIIESAQLDGANFFQELWYICLPLIGGIVGTSIITSISGIFTAEGALVAFWEFGCPPEVVNMGYYFTQQVMLNQNNYSVFPMLSAMGLVFTLVTIPLVYLAKWLVNKVVPEV